VFAWNTLTQLISVYIWLRIATSVLTVLSAWQLRRKQPDLERAFRIPWGSKGLAYAVIAPLIMSGVALIASDKFGLKYGPLVLLLGPLAYFFFRRRLST
jgi:amino acid transporter